MCLATVTKSIERPVAVVFSGWKAFTGSGKDLRFDQFDHEGDRTVPLDRWIGVEEFKLIKADDGKAYLVGFHVFTNEQNKWPQATRRVYYRRSTCIGEQISSPVAVARELYVPSDPDGWPPKE